MDDADLAAEQPLLHLLNAAAEAGCPVARLPAGGRQRDGRFGFPIWPVGCGL